MTTTTTTDHEEVITVHDPVIRGVYDPETRKVACVLLQVAYGGDQRASHCFDTRDWEVAPTPGMMMISAPLSRWRAVAAMKREDRPGPEAFRRPEETQA
jgi:hypothetical protein